MINTSGNITRLIISTYLYPGSAYFLNNYLLLKGRNSALNISQLWKQKKSKCEIKTAQCCLTKPYLEKIMI